MDFHIEKLIKEFDEINDTLLVMKDYVLKYLTKTICNDRKILVADIDGRIKSKESLTAKLNLKGHKYNSIYDITDLLGARVVTFYSDEIDLIASLIEKNFDIDYENSIDKRKIYEVDRFGYMSLHYICRIPKTLHYDKNYPKLNEIKFEIQMRTCLQHVWATIFHDTGYKTDIEVPKEYIRRLARLEGLLEIADAEFLSLRNEINDYRGKLRSLVFQGNFKDVSFSIDSYKAYLALEPFKTLVNRIASINNCDIEEVSLMRYYKILVELGVKTLEQFENIRIENTEDAYKLSLLQLAGTDIDIISSTIGIQNILTIYILKNSKNKAEIKKHFISLYGIVITTDAFVDRIIENTRSIINI